MRVGTCDKETDRCCLRTVDLSWWQYRTIFGTLSHYHTWSCFYVSTATWEGVSGFLEEIKTTGLWCYKSNGMLWLWQRERTPRFCKTHRHCTPPFGGRLYRLHLFAFRPSNIFASPSAFSAELILETVQNSFWSNLMECLYWLCASLTPSSFLSCSGMFFFPPPFGGFMAVSSSLCSDL